MTPPLITLLSDFGLKDPYVAEMKAVILTISPEARIVDISHMIEKFNIRMGAFVLASATRFFPKDTIHVAVVDPSVGTKRRALLIETKHAFYIGPDNGLLMLAAQKDRIQHVYALTNRKLMLPNVSSTFHGRDVFAPASAHFANRTSPSDFGPKIEDYMVPTFAKPFSRAKELKGEILHIDDFGNIITNLTRNDLEKIGAKPTDLLTIVLGNKPLRMKFCTTYGDAPAQNALALIGSHDFLEIAINQGNACKKFRTKAGAAVSISTKR